MQNNIAEGHCNGINYIKTIQYKFKTFDIAYISDDHEVVVHA